MPFEIPNVQAMMLDKLDSIQEDLRQMKTAKLDQNGIDTEKYFTVEKTAEFLDCSTVHVYTLKSKVPHILRGARLYFKKSDLIDYLERGRVVPKSARAARI